MFQLQETSINRSCSILYPEATWKEETSVLRPNILAVRDIVASLSNIPCVSIKTIAIVCTKHTKTHIFMNQCDYCTYIGIYLIHHPLTSAQPDTFRKNGSDHIQIPVVCLSCPPCHLKPSVLLIFSLEPSELGSIYQFWFNVNSQQIARQANSSLTLSHPIQ